MYPVQPAVFTKQVAGNGPRGNASTEVSESAFRDVERKYRLHKTDKRQVRQGKQPPPPPDDFSDVVDARDVAANSAANQAMLKTFDLSAAQVRAALNSVDAASGDGPVWRQLAADAGCSDERPLRALTFAGVPGLTIFPALLLPEAQRRWCECGLADLLRPCHPNNVSQLTPDYVAADGYEPGLRWSTLGYSYQWTTRTYHRDLKSPFPAELATLMRGVVALLPLVDPAQRAAADGYDPQTAIVNYYPTGSTMCAHQDVSEACLQRPLVSLSLGCSCIFLMGTETRDDRPHAFWLRSGDVAVFTGPSRTAFHAVPRVFDDVPSFLLPSTTSETAAGDDDDEERPHEAAGAERPPSSQLRKMQGLRININVRQVFDDAATPACDAAPATWHQL